MQSKSILCLFHAAPTTNQWLIKDAFRHGNPDDFPIMGSGLSLEFVVFIWRTQQEILQSDRFTEKKSLKRSDEGWHNKCINSASEITWCRPLSPKNLSSSSLAVSVCSFPFRDFLLHLFLVGNPLDNRVLLWANLDIIQSFHQGGAGRRKQLTCTFAFSQKAPPDHFRGIQTLNSLAPRALEPVLGLLKHSPKSFYTLLS